MEPRRLPDCPAIAGPNASGLQCAVGIFQSGRRTSSGTRYSYKKPTRRIVMKHRSSCFLAYAVLGALSCLVPVAGHAAESYPSRPIRILVGYAAGGVNDLVARAIAPRLGSRLGQQVVVENRPGAGGNIATELAAQAAPDGYTMLLGSVASLAMSPALLGKVPFDPLNDFAPITKAADVSSLIAAHPTLPARNLKEFVALAKKHPGKLNYASPGTGSISHLSMELFKKAAGIDVVHVPYKGGAPASMDAVAGQVECLVSIISSGAPHVKAGKLRGLAVTTPRRAAILPDVPAVAEMGYPGFAATGWLGLLFPAKTPQEIVNRVYRDAVAVISMPEVKRQFEMNGLEAEASDPKSFAEYIRAEHARWAKVIKDAGIKVK
jgi:tripartite-type tricarboxylate transporter receptor subunit TctC